MKSIRFVALSAVVYGLLLTADQAFAAPFNSSLTVSKPTLMADGEDIQTIRVNIDTDNPQLVDEVNVIVNYPFANQPNNARGYFQWTPGNGFRKLGGDNYGARTVNLLPPNPANSVLGSEVITMPDGLIVQFRWTANRSYGPISDNDVWYHFAESTTGYTKHWSKVDTSFAVVTPNNYTLPSGSTLAVDKSVQQADNQDVQTARLVIHTASPALLDTASIIINYPMSGQPNLARGYFQWTPALGFRSLQNEYYGARYTRLLRENAMSPDQGSQRLVDAAAGTVTFIFRWTAVPGYGAISDNDISYHYAESSTGFSAGWTHQDTSYQVVNTFGNPDLMVSTDSSNPPAQTFVAGRWAVTLLAFRLRAYPNNEDVRIDSLRFEQIVPLTMGSFADYTALYIVDENGMTVGSVVPTSADPVITLNNVVIDRTDTDGVLFRLKAHLSPNSSGHQLGYALASVSASGVSTNMGARLIWNYPHSRPRSAVHTVQ